MTTRSVLIAASLIACSTVAVQAQSTYPKSVENALDANRFMCQSFKREKGFARNDVDLNGDGIKDWLFDYEFAECNGTALIFCGSAGCTLQVLVSDGPGRWVSKYDSAVRGYKIVSKSGRPVLRLDLHGSACGKVGAAKCTEDLTLNRR